MEDGGGLARVRMRLDEACGFLDSIQSTFHPDNCFASFCSSDEHKSYGNLVFKIINVEAWTAGQELLPPADTWTLLSDNGRGTLKVKAGIRVLTLQLQPPDSAGDETVPAERSARKIVGTLFPNGKSRGTGYEHQNSYSHPHVLSSMLYSIVKIAATADWK
jgi:hypothetical protein